MGMDIYGRQPTAPEGKYFRRSVWGWRPLASFCMDSAPEECAPCKFWQSNDGDGLDAGQARALAGKIAILQARGVAQAYCQMRDEALDRLPDEPCAYCLGTGSRKDEVALRMKMTERVVGETRDNGAPNPRAGKTGDCNACHGAGVNRPSETHYSLSPQDIEEWRLFLLACGGFEIL